MQTQNLLFSKLPLSKICYQVSNHGEWYFLMTSTGNPQRSDERWSPILTLRCFDSNVPNSRLRNIRWWCNSDWHCRGSKQVGPRSDGPVLEEERLSCLEGELRLPSYFWSWSPLWQIKCFYRHPWFLCRPCLHIHCQWGPWGSSSNDPLFSFPCCWGPSPPFWKAYEVRVESLQEGRVSSRLRRARHRHDFS